MEGTPQQDRKFIANLSFGFTARDIETADEQTRKVLACAEEAGLQLLDGTVGNTRERDAAESVNYGTDGVWRNMKAEKGEWSPDYAQQHVPAGQTG